MDYKEDYQNKSIKEIKTSIQFYKDQISPKNTSTRGYLDGYTLTGIKYRIEQLEKILKRKQQ